MYLNFIRTDIHVIVDDPRKPRAALVVLDAGVVGGGDAAGARGRAGRGDGDRPGRPADVGEGPELRVDRAGRGADLVALAAVADAGEVVTVADQVVGAASGERPQDVAGGGGGARAGEVAGGQGVVQGDRHRQ